MGIRGLASYFDAEKNPNLAACAQKIKLCAPWGDFKPGLVIDGNGLVYQIVNEFGLQGIVARNGGAYARFEQCAEQWFARLLAVGLTIVVIFDGAGEPQKKETHQSRDADTADKACAVEQALEMGSPPTADDVKPRMNAGLYVACLTHVCRQLKIEHWCCPGEADLEVAITTVKRQFFACLANDSDFFCLQARYIPLQSLKFADGAFTCDLFTPQRVCQFLGIPPSLLPHLACLCGNDYISQEDKPKLHSWLGIPSTTSKNFIDTIGCVVQFLSSLQPDRAHQGLIATLTRTNDPLVEKYQNALLQYDLLASQKRQEQKEPLRTLLQAQSKGQVFGFALKVLGFFLNPEEVFRPLLGASPFMLTPNMTNPQQAQFQAVSAFSRIRARLCDVLFAPGQTVEEELFSADGTIICRRVTKELPSEVARMTGIPLLLWIVGEKGLTPEAFKQLGDDYGPQLQFTILILRTLSRVEPLTQHENCSILRQVSTAGKYAAFLSAPAAHATTAPGQASAAPPKQASATPAAQASTTSWSTVSMPRVIHVVSMYEQCMVLCASANALIGFPVAHPFAQPSLMFDGERLTAALEGKPSLVAPALLAQVEESKKYCRFEENCRWLACPLSHPPGVWGLCRFDGSCTKQDCHQRHLKQNGPLSQGQVVCRFDGRCTKFECSSKHLLQEPTPRPRCNYGSRCTRSGCPYQH